MRGWPLAGAGLIVTAVLAGACSSPLGDDDLWNRPARSDVRDAHAIVSGSGNGVSFAGEGIVVFRPQRALSLHLQTRSGAAPAQLDVLQVAGATYQRAGRDEKWTRTTTAPPDPTWGDATDPQLVGQEQLAGEAVWHLRASRGQGLVEMWVRQRDGYPVRLVTTNSAGATFTFAFDRFNTRDRVAAPTALQLKPPPRNLHGGVGEPLTLNTARVTVLSVDPDAEPEAEDGAVAPRPGNCFLVVEVQVDNVSADQLSTFFDWRLTDARGFGWDQAMAVRQPSFEGGELDPGESSRGFLTYEVSRSSEGLSLSIKIDDDTATFALD